MHNKTSSHNTYFYNSDDFGESDGVVWERNIGSWNFLAGTLGMALRPLSVGGRLIPAVAVDKVLSGVCGIQLLDLH